MRLQFAAHVVRGHAQILLTRAQMARGPAPTQRRADRSVQAVVDACGGVDGAFRRRGGGGPGVGVSTPAASCCVLPVPAVPAVAVHRVVASPSDLCCALSFARHVRSPANSPESIWAWVLMKLHGTSKLISALRRAARARARVLAPGPASTPDTEGGAHPAAIRREAKLLGLQTSALRSCDGTGRSVGLTRALRMCQPDKLSLRAKLEDTTARRRALRRARERT